MNNWLKFVGVAAVIATTGCAPYMVRAENSPFESKDPIAVYVEAGASQEQQQSIRTLAQEFESSAKVKVVRAGNLMRKLQQLSLEPEPDEKTVLALQEEINTIQADLAMSRLKLMLKIRSVLTGEQRLRLVQLLKDHRPPEGM